MAYDSFQSPLLDIPYLNQLVLGGYLPRFSSRDPRKFSHKKIL